MTRWSLSLGRFLGVPIALDFSWFLVFALITWSLAAGYFPAEFPHWASSFYWLTGALAAVLLFFSILLHELGHSVIARRFGVPVQGITLFIFGGVAQVGSEPPRAVAEFWIAIAGPVVSGALAAGFALLASLSPADSPLLAVCKYLALINVAVAAFNLIPAFPLDGGRILRALIWAVTRNFHRATTVASKLGMVFGYLLIGGGLWMLLSGNVLGGIWIAFIGWFLESAARAHLYREQVQNLLSGHTVAEVMSPSEGFVTPDWTLREVVDEHIIGHGRRFVTIRDGEKDLGILDVTGILKTPREEWASTHADEVMTPLRGTTPLSPEAEVWSAMASPLWNGGDTRPVVRQQHVLGALGAEDVFRYLRLLREVRGS